MRNPNSGNRIRDRVRGRKGGVYDGPIHVPTEPQHQVDFEQKAPELEERSLPPIPSPLEALLSDEDAELEALIDEDPFAKD